MRVRGPMLATLAAVGLAYAAYPYVTLYRIGGAIRGGDTKTLEALVDWSSVREGIKEDICDLVVDDPGAKTGGNLPPFGASFMRGIASSSIDQTVTPQALLAATGSLKRPEKELKGADVHVRWAFFDSPTSFLVDLKAPGQTDPIRMEMTLHHGGWQIDRVWLPVDLLSGQGDRT
ncbi:MAG TPA: DUF2939 domain-containing protein [Rhodopila sp.]|jgi:hypothetical protein|nr:DUF2939 domain-containing protein [Rhodopila sp.]